MSIRHSRTRSLAACLMFFAICSPSSAQFGTPPPALQPETLPPALEGGIVGPWLVPDVHITEPTNPLLLGGFGITQVNVDGGGANTVGDAANEPSIAVDPTAPNRMVIGWRQFDSIASNFRQAGNAWSNDGGRTWHNETVFTPGTFRSDPVLDADAQGNIYYSSLKSDFTLDTFITGDGGQSWSSPIPAFGGDKQWIVIDRTGGVGDGNLYQAWSTAAGCCGNNIFTRSTDGGMTYMPPISLPNSPVWGTLAVANDGTLYIAGINFNNGSVYLLRSTNAQNPAQTPTFQSTQIDMGGIFNLGGNCDPNPAGLWGQLWVSVDNSGGPNDGNVYVVASVDPPGSDPLDVRCAISTDGGQSFSASTRVNSDPLNPNSYQWFGTMSVAPNGRIDVVWNDSSESGVCNRSRLYYASSSDGGQTWSPGTAMSPEFDSYLGWPQQNKIGDYYHMRSDLLGADLAWAATFNGEQDVYFLRIGPSDCNGNGVDDNTDLSNGTSQDCNGNGIPDECDIAAGLLADNDHNGVPDICSCLADTNHDGIVSPADFSAWVAAFNAMAPECDQNGDGSCTPADFSAWVANYNAGC